MQPQAALRKAAAGQEEGTEKEVPGTRGCCPLAAAAAAALSYGAEVQRLPWQPAAGEGGGAAGGARCLQSEAAAAVAAGGGY